MTEYGKTQHENRIRVRLGAIISLGPPRAANALLITVFIIYLSAGVVLSIVVPLGEAPDEPAHFRYVRYVARDWNLPVMQARYEDNETVEALQPPMYYYLAAIIAGSPVKDGVDLLRNPAFYFGSRSPAFLSLPEHGFPWQGGYLAWHIIRFFSIALGAVSLWATYRAGLLALESRWLAIAAVAYLAMNPQYVYLHSVVTNDALASLAGSLLTLVALQLVRTPRLKSFVAAALVITLAALSKMSTLTLFPGVVLALLIAWRALPAAWDRRLASGLVVLIPFVCSGWWFLRNQQLYGDLLGLTVAKQALAANYYPEPLSLKGLIDIIPEMSRQTFMSSWGFFGWLSIPLPSSIFIVILLLHLPALIGLAVRSRTTSLRSSVALTLAAAGFGLFLGFFYYAREVNTSGWHGRFLFPGSAIIAMGFVSGWRYWFRHRAETLATLMTVCGGILMVCALAGTVFPAYLPPRFFPPDVSVPNPSDLNFAGGLQLVGYEVEPTVVAPGSRVQVTLYWKIQHKVQEDYRFFVGGFTHRGDLIVSRRESFLSQRYPPMLWPENKVVVDRYQLPVTEDLNQVAGGLQLQVFEGYKLSQLVSILDKAGQPAGDWVDLGQVIVRSGSPSKDLRDNVHARFGNGEILLTGYDLSPTTIQSGENLTVTLHWRAVQQPDQSYQVFVHLFDEEGQLITQHDGPPRMGLYPTSAWSSGETVEDAHPVQIPAAYKGTARISVGLYVLHSLERLRVIDSSGESYPDRAVPLATVVVGR